MINYDDISARAAAIREKFGERDLFRLCGKMGIPVIVHDTPLSVKDFKGLCMIQSRIPVILLNAKLEEYYLRVVLAHELGHVHLHLDRIGMCGFHDFDLFGMKDQFEFEANVFAAELLLENDRVLDVLNQDVTFFGAAQLLEVPPELLDFKFRVMKHQGYAVKPQLMANGDFLKRVERSRY